MARVSRRSDSPMRNVGFWTFFLVVESCECKLLSNKSKYVVHEALCAESGLQNAEGNNPSTHRCAQLAFRSASSSIGNRFRTRRPLQRFSGTQGCRFQGALSSFALFFVPPRQKLYRKTVGCHLSSNSSSRHTSVSLREVWLLVCRRMRK